MSNIENKVVVITGASAIPADTSPRMVVFAMEQPEDVDVNEILFRPTNYEL